MFLMLFLVIFVKIIHMKRVVVASDSFKGCLTSLQVADAAAQGLSDIGASFVPNILSGTAEWRVNTNGTIDVAIHANRGENTPALPRFGLRMFMPKQMNQVTYFGYGPYESYADKLGVPFAVLLGEDEMAANMCSVKNMQSGQQVTLSVEDAAALIRNTLDANLPIILEK